MSAPICIRGLNIFTNFNFRCAGLCPNQTRLLIRRTCYNSLFKAVSHTNKLNYKYFSSEVAKIKPVEVKNESMTFQQMMCLRKKQAQNSVLVELRNKEDISSATSACADFGEIRNLFSYNGESQNVFLFVEFMDESSIKNLLNECQNENITDAFTISSRILRFKKKLHHDAPNISLNINKSSSSTSVKYNHCKSTTVSELIEDLYISEKLSDLSIRLRFFFCRLLKDSMSGLFPNCDAFPFGSSVNGVGKQGCDLDVMISLYPGQAIQPSEFSFLNKTCTGNIQELQRRSVYAFGEYFKTFLPGFSSVKGILKARVPILKLKHTILGMDCDISFNQMSAVLMSEMLYFCGEIDSRVRPLLCAVKKWARDTNITRNYPGTWITNFGLSLLVVYFLQNRSSPILPCLKDALEIVGSEGSPSFKIDYLMSMADLQAKAALNEESLAVLLKEFLDFLGKNPFKNQQISILSGLSTKSVSKCPIWIQYPLQEENNVTINVCQTELDDLCDIASLSSKYLSSDRKEIHSRNLSTILGTPYITKIYASKKTKKQAPEELNLAALLKQQGPGRAKKEANKRFPVKNHSRW